MSANFRPISSAVLIPSRGRAQILAKTLARIPILNDGDTYLGIERCELSLYRELVLTRTGNRCKYVIYDNPEGSVGLAREHLRQYALNGEYDWYVITDDNARFNEHAVNALVQSAEAWSIKAQAPVFMAGMHSTAAHFDRNLIKHAETVDGWRTYPGIGFIFHAVPHVWYSRYKYPEDCFALEDRHMMLTAIDRGMTEFRVCMDAPFSKSRYQPGGQGDLDKRRWNCGRAIERLAHDYPSMVGVRGTFPMPWQFIMSLRQGARPDRLLGGAMRKSEVLTAKKTGLRVRRQKRS